MSPYALGPNKFCETLSLKSRWIPTGVGSHACENKTPVVWVAVRSLQETTLGCTLAASSMGDSGPHAGCLLHKCKQGGWIPVDP